MANDQGGMLQNLALMTQALGLGGFPHFAAHPFIWFQTLGFRMQEIPFSRTIGAGAGLLMGGRMVKTYDWRTEWFVPAPLPVVYEAMTSREALRRWWPVMELVDEGGEDELGVGSRVSFRVHQAPEIARLAPPFHIHCVYTDVEPERRLREVVTGDLSGVLETLFREDPGRPGTHVTFNWYVRVTNPVLNMLGYLIGRMYRHSHDSVMSAGESGLSDYCVARTTA